MSAVSRPPHELDRRPAINTWLAVVITTLGLGATVAVSWFVFGGSASFRGPLRAVQDSWLPIYALQAVLAAAGMFVLGRLGAGSSAAAVAKIVAAAWIGEFLVLLVGGRLFSGELVPEVSWFYWLLGTAGPVQPVAALVGGLIGLRARARWG